MRYLVVSATKAEAAHLPDGLPLVVTGMGKVAAAAATAAALAAYDDLAGLTVVNIGTAGALKDGLVGLHLPSAVLTTTSTPTPCEPSATTHVIGWTSTATGRCWPPVTRS